MKLRNDPRKCNTQQFIEKSIKIHGNKFDYSKVNYISNKKKVEIICNNCKHHFWQKAHSHYYAAGCGCPKCSNRGPYTLEDFIEKAKAIHNNKYDYSNVVYTKSWNKVDIKCNVCGKNCSVRAAHHLSGIGCSCTKESIGEKKIKEVLNKLKIKFEHQYLFDNCKDKHRLRFDFAIELNSQLVIIEYQGELHYQPYNKKINTFEDKIKKDCIKKQYLKNNKIKLIEIYFWEKKDIEEKLTALLKGLPWKNKKKQHNKTTIKWVSLTKEFVKKYTKQYKGYYGS